VGIIASSTPQLSIGIWRQAIDAVLVLCYLVVFLSTLINAPIDQMVYHTEVANNGVYSQDDDDGRAAVSAFVSVSSRWHVFNGLRSVGSILGWLLSVVAFHSSDV